MLNSKRIQSIALLCAVFVAVLPAGADVLEVGCSVPVEAIGQVVTLDGSAIYGGETISTGSGSSAGFLVGDVLTQLGPGSRATIDTTANDTPDVHLTQGSVRVIDPRDLGPPVQLDALGASTQFTGNDVGVAIADGGAEFCADSPLALTRGGRTTTKTPGACGAGIAGGAFGTPAGGAIPISGDTCLRVATNSHLSPLPPVSGRPNGPPIPDPPDSPPRNPCEVGACGRGGEPPRVTEQPPSEGGFPGGGGTFGGS